MLREDWLGPPPPPLDRDAALALLARRYLAGHGPADDRDLAQWAGLPLRRRAPRPGRRGAVQRADGLAELPGADDRAAAGAAAARPVRPPAARLDVARAGARRAHGDVVTSNGIFRPVALVRGRAVATWGLAGGQVQLRPFAPLDDADRAALDADAQDVVRYLAAPPPAARPDLRHTPARDDESGDRMTTYLVTGGTGFLGRHLLARLVRRPGAAVHVLVRPGSVPRLERLTARLQGPGTVEPLLGDVRAELLGLGRRRARRPGGPGRPRGAPGGAVRHDRGRRRQRGRSTSAAPDGRSRWRRACAARHFHHVSSIAVAGEHAGVFDEDDVRRGPGAALAYHATKYEAERLVREQTDVPWRVYRPVDRRRRQPHRRDGQGRRALLLPAACSRASASCRAPGTCRWCCPTSATPTSSPSTTSPTRWTRSSTRTAWTGARSTSAPSRMVPLLEVYNALARAAGAPQVVLPVTRRLLPSAVAAVGLLAARARGAQHRRGARRAARHPAVGHRAQHVPPGLLHRPPPARCSTGSASRPPPELREYAYTLYMYWAQHLDPLRARRRPVGSPLNGRTVVVTGASSGIGRTTALAVAARGGIAAAARPPGAGAGAGARRDRRGRRQGVRLHGRPHVERVGRRVREADARRPRRHRHAGQQRRPLDPALGAAVVRPLPRLRAHDGAELLRAGAPGARPAAAHDAAALRPHRQRVVDRGAGQPAALLRLRREQGGARRVQPGGRAPRSSATA